MTAHGTLQAMLWLRGIQFARTLPAAWLIDGGAVPGTRAERSALRHATTRAALAAQLGVPAADIDLSNDAAGRLLASSSSGVAVHASHGTRDGLVIVAMADRRVGADIERIGAGSLPFAALHRAEQLWLHQLPEPERDEAFARLWAAKEAHGKWAGTGLPETDRFATLPVGRPGSFRVAGYAHVDIATHVITWQQRNYALAVATG